MKEYGSKKFGNPGDYKLVDSCKHRLYQPKNSGSTRFRVVPVIVDGKPEPQYIDEGVTESSLTDAFITAEVASFVGTKSYHMMCPTPPEGTNETVMMAFYSAINEYVTSHPKTADDNWRRWLGLKGEGDTKAPMAILRKPSKMLFMQGILYENGGKPVKEDNGKPIPLKPVALGISITAYRDMIKNMLEPLDNNAPLSPENNKMGDLLSLDKGRMLHILPYTKEFEGERKSQIWYRAEMGDVMPIALEEAQSIWKPWNEVLNLNESPTIIMRRLVSTFSAKAVLCAFKEHPVYSSYIPKDVCEETITVQTQEETPSLPTPPAPPSPSITSPLDQQQSSVTEAEDIQPQKGQIMPTQEELLKMLKAEQENK